MATIGLVLVIAIANFAMGFLAAGCWRKANGAAASSAANSPSATNTETSPPAHQAVQE